MYFFEMSYEYETISKQQIKKLFHEHKCKDKVMELFEENKTFGDPELYQELFYMRTNHDP